MKFLIILFLSYFLVGCSTAQYSKDNKKSYKHYENVDVIDNTNILNPPQYIEKDK